MRSVRAIVDAVNWRAFLALYAFTLVAVAVLAATAASTPVVSMVFGAIGAAYVVWAIPPLDELRRKRERDA